MSKRGQKFAMDRSNALTYSNFARCFDQPSSLNPKHLKSHDHLTHPEMHNDCHFTLLGFTALDGSPVFCVIIIAGIKQMYVIQTGLDMDAKMVGDQNDSDFLKRTEERASCTLWVQSASSSRGRPPFS